MEFAKVTSYRHITIRVLGSIRGGDVASVRFITLVSLSLPRLEPRRNNGPSVVIARRSLQDVPIR